MVFIGGGLGAVARYGVNTTALRFFGPELPWGTLTVKIAGSFVMGLFWAYVASHLDDVLPLQVRLLVAMGFLGGFTTFSAFSLDAVHLWERGSGGAALGYMVGSVILSVGALVVGQWVARNLMS